LQDVPIDVFVGAYVSEDQRVYDDPLLYWCQYLAGWDLDKARSFYENYSPFQIYRAAMAKQKTENPPIDG